MARPRDFDTDTVLAQAAAAFTVHGFHGTSVATLTDATGLGKQSLYNAFGDKEALYVQAIEHVASCFAPVVDAMASSPTGLHAVQTFFAQLLAACLSDDPTVNNCIVSAGLLEGLEEGAINDKLRQTWAASRRMLLSAVKRGQSDGSIRSDVTATALADSLMTLMGGLRVSARAVSTKGQLKAVTQLGLEVLHPR
jgi:TetR/AcrR family transcriptional regulator, transcriptional repressor for nem operon